MLFNNVNRNSYRKKKQRKEQALALKRLQNKRNGDYLQYYKDNGNIDSVDETPLYDLPGTSPSDEYPICNRCMNEEKESESEEKMTMKQKVKQKVMACVSFSLHFIFVMLLLFGGAMAFAYLEDPESFVENSTGNDDTSGKVTGQLRSAENLTQEGDAAWTLFWIKVQNNYNLSLESNEREKMMELFTNFINEETERNNRIAYKKLHTKKFALLKWLYFVTVATTTVGYGDVSPKTDNGKIFYMIFSVVGVILMMSLLARCGSVVSYANVNFFNLLKKYLCRGKMDDDGKDGKEPFISSELLTSISILLIFGGYLYAGIWYGQYVAKIEGWSYIDTIYFWIVTFTTVGFGDITQPLETEVEHIYLYVVYRVFGLAFLAAIIDALSAYSEYKTEECRAQAKKRLEEQKKKLMEKQNQLRSMANEKMNMTKESTQGNLSRTVIPNVDIV